MNEYLSGTTGWVINVRILILVWTISLSLELGESIFNLKKLHTLKLVKMENK